MRLKINLLILAFALTGCGGLVPKKYPPRSKGETFYDFSDKAPLLFHYRCDDNNGTKNCKETPVDIVKEWDFFNHGKFIVIPERYCL